MIYKAVEVIWIFLADGRAGRTEIEGSIRGPRGPKKRKGMIFFINEFVNVSFITFIKFL